VLVMYAGQIVEAGPTREVLRSPQHPYTWMLMRAVPDLDTPRGRQLINIEGSPPELDVLPSGCSFHPRCPHALEQCRVEDPPPAPGTENHLARCWVLMRNVTQGAPGPAKTPSGRTEPRRVAALAGYRGAQGISGRWVLRPGAGVTCCGRSDDRGAAWRDSRARWRVWLGEIDSGSADPST
jgi:oligopeptide/dipeptide ABC transporter ATP-binding protein